jgi:hypothetical protein
VHGCPELIDVQRDHGHVTEYGRLDPVSKLEGTRRRCARAKCGDGGRPGEVYVKTPTFRPTRLNAATTWSMSSRE